MKWERIAPRYRSHAHKLRQALAGALELHVSGKWGRGEIEAAALRDYERVFGHPIVARSFWRIFDRVLNRAASAGNFDGLEIYLPTVIGAKPKLPAFEKAAADLCDLASAVHGVGDPTMPSAVEVQLIWDAACNEWGRLTGLGMGERKAKKAILRALVSSGVDLARTRSALRVNLSRKLERWIEGGYSPEALRDRRSTNSGRRQPLPLSEKDRSMLIARSLTGSLSKAWRETLSSGQLSPGVVQAYIGNPASKSYVPQRVRDLLAPDVEMLQDLHHGPRQAKLNGAYITRDWSAVLPGDWYQADDCTLPLYYWEQDENGQVHAIRGQCLVMIDCGTNRVLTLALHSARNYNARVIRGLILHTHDVYGLPREGFYFERGIWKSSKLIKGASDEIPSEETEIGLREWCRFVHARLPRSKPVERVLGLLQDRMEDQPGYAGRNEQTEKFERLQRSLLEMRSGNLHPREFLLHRDEWVTRLTEICDAYNQESQEGRLKGRSPREAWDASFGSGPPLTRLSEETRYLLANHRRPLKVTKNGICVQLGKERRWFRNEATGRIIGRMVQVYFNPDDLSSIFVMRNRSDQCAFVVPVAPIIPAMSATREQMDSATRSCAEHNRPAQTLYAAVRPHFPENRPSPFRPVAADSSSVELGREIAAEQAVIREQQSQEVNTQRKITNYRKRLGGTRQQEGISPERQLAGYQLLDEANQDADSPTKH